MALLFPALPGFAWAVQTGNTPTPVTIAPQSPLKPPDPLPGLPAAVVTKGPKDPLHVVLVDKSRQRLYLYLYQPDGRINLIRSFPCSTGKAVGNKIKEGDRRTPEGVYFFTKAYHDNKVTIFGTTAYHLNYPDPFDMAEGREGNGIYLHGTNRPLGSRDTNGCVVMNNPDLDFVRQRIGLHDTPIIISPRLSWISPEELERDREELLEVIRANWTSWFKSIVQDTPEDGVYDLERSILLRQNGRILIRTPVLVNSALAGWKNIYLEDRMNPAAVLASLWMPKGNRLLRRPAGEPPQSSEEQLLGFLQGWVKAWESRDVNEYMAYYSKGFRAYGMRYREWRAYKRSLARKYRAIDVEIFGIKMKVSGPRARITFRQKYYSDQFHDDGIKVLELRFENSGWKIRSENWTPVETMEAKR